MEVSTRAENDKFTHGKVGRRLHTSFRHLHEEKLLAFFRFGDVCGNKRVLFVFFW
jgi:hypothetical protein